MHIDDCLLEKRMKTLFEKLASTVSFKDARRKDGGVLQESIAIRFRHKKILLKTFYNLYDFATFKANQNRLMASW